MRRRATQLIVVMAAALLLASGVAIAANVSCKSGSTSTKPCKGTPDPDTILGTGGIDFIKSLESNDVVDARAGDDKLYGDEGADALYGKGGNDTIDGGPGNDNYKTQFTEPKDDPNGPDIDPNPPFGAGLRGASGNDTINGQAGDDDLIGNPGQDILDERGSSGDLDRAFGGTENDRVYADDNDVSDEVSCGEGLNNTEINTDNDIASINVIYSTRTDGKVDKTIVAKDADKVYDCETITDQDGDPVDKNLLPQYQPGTASYDTTEPAEPQ